MIPAKISSGIQTLACGADVKMPSIGGTRKGGGGGGGGGVYFRFVMSMIVNLKQ